MRIIFFWDIVPGDVQSLLSNSHLSAFLAHSYPPHCSLILPLSLQGCSQAETNTSYARLVGLCFLTYHWDIFDWVLVDGPLFCVVICHTIFIIFFNFKKSSSSLTLLHWGVFDCRDCRTLREVKSCSTTSQLKFWRQDFTLTFWH